MSFEPVQKMLSRRLIVRIAAVLAGATILIVLGIVGWIYFFPEQVARQTINTWRRNAQLTRHTIELPNGYRCAYLEGGTGEPIVLLHGFGGDKDNFTPVASFLTRQYRVIAPDLAGFGESSRSAVDFSPPAQGERVHSLVQALRLDRFHLGGSSMGGQIAVVYAAAHPTNVATLWLLAPAGVWSAPKSEIFRDIARGKPNPMLVRTEADFARLFPLVVHKPPPLPRPVLRVLAKARIENYSLEERIFPQIATYSIEEVAGRVKSPALIVWGDKDRSLHVEGGRILNRLIPNSQLIVLQDIGHLPMIETPERVASDFLVFQHKR